MDNPSTKPVNWPFKYNKWDNNYNQIKNLNEEKHAPDAVVFKQHKMTKEELREQPEGNF